MKRNNIESGQALVGGLILILIVLFFCAYFVFVSESYFRFFSNAEQANMEIVKETTNYAHILNEISLNNQNIIASLSVSENALLKSLEYGIYLGFHQPYWVTYSTLQDQNELTQSEHFQPNVLSSENKIAISRVFHSYALNSARGFFLAKSLAKRNEELLNQLPSKMRKYFIQSSNSSVLCFALQTQKEYYKNPGIVHFPVLNNYHFYLEREASNECAIKHTVSKVNKFLEFSLPIFYSSTEDKIIDYSRFNSFSVSSNSAYGILYVLPSQKYQFINDIKFFSPKKISEYDKRFSFINEFLSHFAFFKNILLGKKNDFLQSPLSQQFKITHKFIYCAQDNSLLCSFSEEQFLRAFFYPHWAVSGVYQ